MDNLSGKFAKNLKRLRKKSGLTQNELAERLGYSEKSISKWESGTTVPSVEAILNLASVLKTDMSEFFIEVSDVFFLGIDAGGTKSQFKLCDKNGNTVEEYTDTACNVFDLGIDKCKEVLKRGIDEVCKNVPYSLVVMYAGIAGGFINEKIRKQLNDFFKEFGFLDFDNGSDIENIIAAGLVEKDGITLIMGTGVSLFRVKNNEKIRSAGWGYLFDEGGSAFNIGQEALKAYFSAYDGVGEVTYLTKYIEEKTQCSATELLPKLYDEGKRYIASFAPIVFECAEKHNDKISKDIIDRNITFVAKLISKAVEEYDGNTYPIPVVIAGGLTNQPVIIDALYEKLDYPDKCNLFKLDVLPIEGAVKEAKRLWEKNRLNYVKNI